MDGASHSAEKALATCRHWRSKLCPPGRKEKTDYDHVHEHVHVNVDVDVVGRVLVVGCCGCSKIWVSELVRNL